MKPTIVLVHGAFAESASWNLLNSTATFLDSLASRPERTTHEH